VTRAYIDFKQIDKRIKELKLPEDTLNIIKNNIQEYDKPILRAATRFIGCLVGYYD